MDKNTDYEKLLLEEPADDVRLEVKEVTRRPLPPMRKKGGCCGCCGKLCLVLFVGTLGLFLLGMGFMYVEGGKIVRKITVTEPKDLPVVDIPQAKLDLVKDRAMLFVDKIRAGETPQDDFVVTAEEINGFFGHSDFLRGNMYTTLNGEKQEMKTQYSLPTGMLPGGKNRYFVGTEVVDIDDEAHTLTYDLDVQAFQGRPLVMAVFKYAMNDSDQKHLDIYLQKLQILGENQAEEFISQRYNLLEDFYNDPDNAEVAHVVEQIESISIENDSLVVKPRRDGSLKKIANVVVGANKLKNHRGDGATASKTFKTNKFLEEKTMLRKSKAEP